MMPTSESAVVHRLSDYTPYPWNLDSCFLDFNIDAHCTRVTARLTFSAKEGVSDLVLNGEQVRLVQLVLDGRVLTADDYSLDDVALVIPARLLQAQDGFTVETIVDINPAGNKALEGLYQSGNILCTQCEAEGFRRITYYPDRPDVMTQFDVRIQADRKTYPLLLSNGNLVDSGDLGDDHYTLWSDPFKKPCYLFALVAGDLLTREDRFVTTTNRLVRLQIHTEKHNVGKSAYALESLKKAMAWDEYTFGREYDLDIYQIVAVDDFNSGAMENKSLNIFNSQCVLASQETTVDSDYESIESIVAHEYFHNWSGNRVTLRDWFQLSLKEGFTVYRDALFTADNRSAAIKRIKDAQLICSAQFAEDAGPMAHPVRPSSYTEIRNFYTLTVYEKGAEVIGMLETILGWDTFRAGCDEYFRRYDGQAVTVEAFITVLESVSSRSLAQFMLWYKQAGTPTVIITDEYDRQTGRYTVRMRQSLPATPGEHNKQAMLIPVRLACLSASGELLPLDDSGATETVVELDREEKTFDFVVRQHPVPSFLRNFSAPVQVQYNYSNAQLALLLHQDTDAYSRWSAGQELKTRIANQLIATSGDYSGIAVRNELQTLVSVFAGLIEHCLIQHKDRENMSLTSLLLTLPSRLWLEGKQKIIQIEKLDAAVRYLHSYLAVELADLWFKLYEASRTNEPYSPDYSQAAIRRLKNLTLMYLVHASEQGQEVAWQQFRQADNMTDTKAALDCLVYSEHSRYGEDALAMMYDRWQHEPLVVNQWLEVQAGIISPDTLARVDALLLHPAFDIENPNKVRSLIGVYAFKSYTGFHRQDGAGYTWLGQQLLRIDSFNPQVAARLATALSRWRRYENTYSTAMKRQLEVLQQSNISKDLREVVSKSLSETVEAA